MENALAWIYTGSVGVQRGSNIKGVSCILSVGVGIQWRRCEGPPLENFTTCRCNFPHSGAFNRVFRWKIISPFHCFFSLELPWSAMTTIIFWWTGQTHPGLHCPCMSPLLLTHFQYPPRVSRDMEMH